MPVTGLDSGTHPPKPTKARRTKIERHRHQCQLTSPARTGKSRAQIAFVDITASAGGGAMNEPGACDPTQNLAITTAMLRKITTSPSSELRIITISGDSMAPVLEHGDIVMLD